MTRRTLLNIGWRYLLRHPWQSILMVIGITLGVAVVVAIDLANTSASRAFDLSTASVTGKATHQITGGPFGLDDSVYTLLRREGIAAPTAPIISEYVSSPLLGNRPIQLLGIDPFAEAPFRDYFGRQEEFPNEGQPRQGLSSTSGGLTAFLTRPGAIFISIDLAKRYDLNTGQTIPLETGGQRQNAFIAGLMHPKDALSRRALDGLILADIATAQELTGRLGKIDRIDLILPERAPGEIANPYLVEGIQALLPPEARLLPVETRSGGIEQMTTAFRVNLTALSMLALVVGMFLIYNTITFSVIQRRPLFGTLRCLGVTRREVFFLVLSEALIIGVLGAILGMILGTAMGQGAVRLVTQTVNDLFFVVTVQGVQIPLSSLIKGSLLGIFATILTAAPPAWEAASVPPRVALSRSGLESKARHAISLAAVLGVFLVMLGMGTLAWPSRSLVISFAGTFAIVVGFAMLVPIMTGLLMRAITPGLGRFWGTLGRMAPRDVANSLSRTSIAVMALMVAVSVTIGVSLMVSSFRATVITWLEETLQGDVYISAPSMTATTPSTAIDPAILETLQDWPGVARVDTLRSVNIDSPQGVVNIAATDNLDIGKERIFVSTDVSPEQIWEQLQNGAVIVSEPLASRLNLPSRGGTVTLFTRNGTQQFPVIGIYYDYASTQGTVLMALPIYQVLWRDPAITAIALRMEQGIDADQLAHELQDALSPRQRLLIRANRVLREEVLAVFDRTFAITGALQLLATIVAFIGVLSALFSLEMERKRELGILRSIGMTVRQLWTLIMLETGLMGTVAGLLAMPTGYVLALILIFIINRRSFGWTLQMQVSPLPFLEALAVAVIAALLAGFYPALRMGKMITSEALRSE